MAPEIVYSYTLAIHLFIIKKTEMSHKLLVTWNSNL